MTVETAKYFGKLSAVIASAAAIAASIFALSNSLLRDLLPQVPRATQAVEFASFGTTVLVLVLVLMIRKRLSIISQYVTAAIALGLLVAAAFCYLSFSDLAFERVYYYPPTVPPEERRPYISAPYHEAGAKLAAHLDTATAVSTFGGPEIVNGHELLWTQASLNTVFDRFVRSYVLIAFLMTASLLTAAIAVWRVFDAQASVAGGKEAGTSRDREPRRTHQTRLHSPASQAAQVNVRVQVVSAFG